MGQKGRVVHYLNQFFGQVGGEEQAGIPPLANNGPVGPGLALQAALGDSLDVVGTVICGDNYFNQGIEIAAKQVVDLIRKFNPDVVAAGPAFNAGRYGIACGAVAREVSQLLDIPVVGGMFPENPGVDLYRQHLYIIETGASAAGMRTAVAAMASLIAKLARGEELGDPQTEGYLPRGIRKNIWHRQRGAERAVEMLLKKLRQEGVHTEYPMPLYDRVKPARPLASLSHSRIALLTTGGIVPQGNPDRIESSSASRYGRYRLDGINDLLPEQFQTVHGGYDPTFANQDPDRVLPLDSARSLEREGVIGTIHPYYYATVGNGTSVANARRFAAKIVEELKAEKVDGVILTST